MKNKRDGYYGRSRSREGSSDRRRSSRSRRRSRSSREKSEYRSMTRSRSRERYSRKSKRSRSSSSSSSGSSSSSSRSRSRKSSPYHDSNNRRPVDKGGFPFTLPTSGQFGGEAPRPGGAPWFDGNRGGVPGGVPPPAPPPPPAAFPPPPHRTPPAPPPPSIDLTSPMPPPAPTFDSRPIPSIQHEEPRNFPPPNFPAEDPGRFGNNFQGNFPSGYDVPYYPPGTNVGQYPPSGPNPPHQNFNPAEHQPPNSNWNFPQGGMPQQLGPPPFKEAPNGPPPAAQPPSKEAIEHSKKEAVEQELAQQKRTLAVQREEYFKRKITLTRELTRLKDQKRELINEDSSVNDRILKENSKLQGEILNKLKSMDNVIEMLSNIIGDKAEIAELMKETSYAVGSPKSNDKRKRSMSRSPGRSKAKNKSKSPVARGEKPVNIVHYDPELHWCSVCDVFPRTVTQYLSHLHSEGHQQELKNKKKGKKEEELMPWRTRENREPSPPRFKNAPNKRVPLRGVQFLVPSTAWYCSMCKVWLGDMDAATRHLKAPKHASIYHEFTIQNPHWEVDWLTERTRAYERNSDAKSKSQSAIKEDASPRKSAPNANEEPKTEKSAPPTAALDMANFGDRLLAMLAASSKSNLIAVQKEHKKEKKERKSSSSSGSSSESDYEKKKKKKKRKKEEKKKRKGDRENRRDESSKGKKYDDDDKESEDRSMKKRHPNKLDDRPVAPRDWDSEPPDRSNRGRSNSKPQQSSKDFRTGPKNVKAGPEFPERDFLGPGKNAAHDSRISSREDSYYGPKEPPKIDEVIRAAREKERKEEEKRPKGKLYVPGRDDKDGGGKKQEKETKRESSVDKKSSDSAVKKKDVMKPFSIPKAKLPFIGRMPILKKKIDPKPAEPEVPKPQPATEEVDQPPIPKSKFSNAEPVEESAKTDEAAGLPKSTLIISKRPPMSEPEVAMKIDNLQEQDMEIEDDSAPPPPPPPPPPKDEPAAPKVSAEENPAAEGSELHKDFKDALDLLFPEQKTEEEPEPEPEPVQLTESEQVTLSTTSAPPQTYQQPTNYNMYQQSGAPSYDNMGYYDQTAAYHHHMQQQQMSYMAAMGYDQSNMNMFPPAGPPPNYGMQQMYPPPAMMAPQMNSGYPQGMDVIPPLPVEPPAEHSPGMGYHPQNSDQSSSEAAEETAPPKKKNAPGQRLRRHFRKKAMQAEALKEAQPAAEGETAEDDDAQNPMTLPSPKPAKLRPEDLSELALLGIEEGDITAQSFY